MSAEMSNNHHDDQLNNKNGDNMFEEIISDDENSSNTDTSIHSEGDGDEELQQQQEEQQQKPKDHITLPQPSTTTAPLSSHPLPSQQQQQIIEEVNQISVSDDLLSISDFRTLSLTVFQERSLLLEQTAKENGDLSELLVNNVNSIIDYLLVTKERIRSENGKYFIRETLNKLVRAFMTRLSLTSSLLELINSFFQKALSIIIFQLQFYLEDKKVEEQQLREEREKKKKQREESNNKPNDGNNTHEETDIHNTSATTTTTKEKIVAPSAQELQTRKQIEDEAFILAENIEIIMQSRNPFYTNNGVYSQNFTLLQQDIEKWTRVMNDNVTATWNKDYEKFIFAFPSTKAHKSLSSLLMHNINYFGQAGGYVLLMDLFELKTISLRIFKKCLRIFQKSLEGLYRVQDELVPRVKQITLNYIREMEDDTLKVQSWDNIKEIISLSNSMFRRYQPERSIEYTETLQLEILFKLFSSGIIEKRLFALNEIKTFIKGVCEEEFNNKKSNGFQQRFLPLPNLQGTPSSPGGQQNNNSSERTKWHTTKTLVKWIDEKKLLEGLFLHNMHSQLIRQSKPILLFLAESRGLKSNEVELIWKSSVGKHEEIQRTIYELIIGIMSNLNMQTTNMFFDQIESINEAYLNEHTLEFVRNFVVEAVLNVKKSKDKKSRQWNGLGIFWNFVMSEQLDSRLSQKAFDCLRQLVCREEFEVHRKSIIKSCLINLKEHRNAPRTCQLIQTIIETYPTLKKKKKASVYGIIEYMNEKVKLFDVFSADLSYAIERFLKTGVNGTSGKQNQQKSNVIDNHLREVEIRLDFFNYILRNSSLTITFSQCLSLWTSLSKGEIYRDLCCTWFESLVQCEQAIDNTTQVLADGTVEKLFNEVIRKIDTKTMRQSEFSLFHTYFLAVNIKNKLIEVKWEEEQIDQRPGASNHMENRRASVLLDQVKPTDEGKEKFSLHPKMLRSKSLNQVAQNAGKYVKQQIQRASSDRNTSSAKSKLSSDTRRVVKRYIVLSADLIGIDQLWEVVMNVDDVDVAQQAIQYLNNYRYDFSKDMKTAVAEFTEAHIAKCLEQLTTSNNSDNPDRERKIQRCLGILLDYLYLFGEKTGVKGHGISSTGVPLRIRVCPLDAPKFSLTLQSTDNVSRLFKSVSAELNHPVYLIQLFSLGTSIANDNRTMDEIGLRDHQTVIVKKVNVKDVGLSLLKFQLKALGLDALADVLMKQAIESLQPIARTSSDELPSDSEPQTPVAQAIPRGEDMFIENDKYVMLLTEDEKSYPANVLSKDENFAKLISLLEISDTIAEKVWLLLLHLPTNAKMSKLIHDIARAEIEEQINWSIILPKDASVYKLLYSLQIIDVSVKNQARMGLDLDSWNEKFVRFGGVDQLIAAIPTKESSGKFTLFSQTPLHKECLALILKLISRFLPDYMSNSRLFNKMSIPNIIESIAHIIPASISFGQNDESSDDDFNEPNLVTVSKRPTSKTYRCNQGFLNMVGTDYRALADRALIEQTMSILYTAVSIHADSLTTIREQESFLKFLATCMIDCTSKDIRLEIANGLERLLICKDSNESELIHKRKSEVKAYIVSLLFKYLGEVQRYEATCEQYFSLLEHLLLDFTRVKIDNTLFDDRNALTEALKLALLRPIVEERSSSNSDKVLIGLLNIITVLLRLNPDMKRDMGSKEGVGIIDEIFNSFLFQVPSAGSRSDKPLPPKCKTTNSRRAAFALLVEFVDECSENYSELVELVTNYLSNCERHSVWRFNAESMERCESGFVGLKNQGATCYMNSLLQQFFMTMPLRKGLFSVELNDPTKEENTALLAQMQTLFGYLQHSTKRYYDTRPFCSSYKISGTPINCYVQQDANEFFNLFLDKIESALKGTPQENLLKNVFGGSILNQLIFENTVSETLEPFSIMGLEIKNKKNILESLELYVTGEMLDGNNKYYSESLKKHVDALKRAVVKDLPNVLIFHLKRFEFDFEKMKHVKLNDRCEFPHDLDMEPYTEEGMERRENRGLKDVPPAHRDPSYYKYRLVGVLVHMGSADSGHYYSYIMDRSRSNGKPVWYEFNDTNVSVFDESNLEKQTFGGFEEIIVKDQGKTTVRNTVYRSNNAYMLFYQRVSTLYEDTFEEYVSSSHEHESKTFKEDYASNVMEDELHSTRGSSASDAPISVYAQPSPLKVKHVEQQFIDEDETDEKNSLEVEKSNWSRPLLAIRFLVKLSKAARKKDIQQQKQADIPHTIKKAVWKDNSRFYHDKYVFNETFDMFMWNLLNLANNNQERTRNVQLATKYVIDIVAHSTFTKVLVKWFEYLQNIFVQDKSSCLWFLEALIENLVWRSELLLKCPDPEIRQGFVSLLLDCANILSKDEKYDISVESSYTYSQNVLVSDDSSDSEERMLTDPSATILRRFINSVLSLLGECRYYTRQTTEFFMFLSHFALIGFQERKYLIDKGVISILVQLLNGDIPDPTKEFSFNRRIRMNGLVASFGSGPVYQILQLLSTLVLTCETSSTRTSQTIPESLMRSESDVPIDLPTRDRDKLFHREFFACMIYDDTNMAAVQNILSHWCWENMHVSVNFTDLVIKELATCYNITTGGGTGIGVTSSTTTTSLLTPSQTTVSTSPSKIQQLERILLSLETMMSVTDSLHTQRVEEILKKLMRHIHTYMREPDPTLTCVKFLTKQAGRLESVKNWLVQDENKRDLEKVCRLHDWKLKYNVDSDSNKNSPPASPRIKSEKSDESTTPELKP